jgi:hypothetical protein
MNYQKNYEDYINYVKTLNRSKSKDVYYEEHHILPKCIGGNNNKENLILLTPREHFLAHYLLSKIYNDTKIKKSFYLLSNVNNRIISSQYYKNIKRKISMQSTGCNNTASKKVICVETGEIFNTITDANRKYKTTKVGDCCNKTRATAGGFHWDFYIENKEYNLIDYAIGGYEAVKQKLSKKIICVETSEVFESITEASDKTKTRLSSISMCLNKKLNSANNLHWDFFFNDKEYNLKDYITEIKRGGNSTFPKKVICVETGEIFDSVRKAAKDKGLKSLSSLINAINRNKISCGFHWRYL